MGQYENHFQDDDYDHLNLNYFKILRDENQMIADPSGWINTYSKVGIEYPKFGKRLQGYNADISNQLKEKKKHIVDLLSEWDSDDFLSENITLCHSATVGSVITMAFLISRGINTIIMETPCYFASLYQAKRMGLKVIRIPTYYEEEFHLIIDKEIVQSNTPCAIWLTQPRTALGFNQNLNELKQLLNNLSEKDFIIIDEATEQLFPSILSKLSPRKHPQIIKIRSLFKGLGVNGIRLACIIHHSSFRSEMENEMEIFLGALDVYSLGHAVDMGRNIPKFRMLLSISNEQVIKLRERAEKLIKGTDVEVSKIENGYIGSAIVKFKQNPTLSSLDRRINFIKYCTEEKVPVILGSSMGFATHPNIEFIRLNYFNRDYNILEGLRIISRFNN